MGREIVRRLVERGHDVSVLHRRDRHDLGPAVGKAGLRKGFEWYLTQPRRAVDYAFEDRLLGRVGP